jgi:hypothetical protein
VRVYVRAGTRVRVCVCASAENARGVRVAPTACVLQAGCSCHMQSTLDSVRKSSHCFRFGVVSGAAGHQARQVLRVGEALQRASREGEGTGTALRCDLRGVASAWSKP